MAYFEAEDIMREEAASLNECHELMDGDMEFIVNDKGKLEVYIHGQQL